MREELIIVEEAAATTNELAELERLYSMRNPLRVRRFLGEHSFLAALLVSAYDATTRYFAPLSLVLEVIADPEISNDEQLVLFVSVQLKPAEAFTRLQRFDNEWWLDALGEARGHLCISLEFR